jgi:tetratricopeptide (TPR) repeat protein
VDADELFGPVHYAPVLAELAELTKGDFRRIFRKSAIWRARYEGFLRNVAVALGNSGDVAMREPLERLSAHESELISTTARRALNRLLQSLSLLLVLLVVPQIRAFSNGMTLATFTADPGFSHFYNNEFDEALAVFEGRLKSHPNDAEMYNHVAQVILYREMLRDGALESQLVSGNNPFLRRAKMDITRADKQRFNECLTKSTKLSEAELRISPRDTNALAALAVAHGLRANYLFLVEKAWIESLREATAARKADEKILEIDPQDADANLILGLNEYVVGSLPFYMRALGFLGGFHGDRKDGITKLEFVAKNGIRNHYDAEVLLAVIYRRERDSQQAIPLLKDLAATFPRNYLFRFEQVQMYSDFGDKQSALRTLTEIEGLRSSDAPGYGDLKAEKIKYLKGNLLFWYGDLNPALADLKQATQRAEELDLNTAVLAWLRLGQVYDLQGNHLEAIGAYRETMKTAPKSEAASEAKGYISSPYHRKQKDNS